MTFFTKRKKEIILLCIGGLSILLFVTTDYRRVRGNYESPSLPRPPFRCFASNPRKKVIFHDTPIINKIKYSYLINVKNACANKNVEVVMPVHSSITNARRRKRTRNFRQGRFAQNKRNKVLMLFFVGLPSEKLPNASYFQLQLQNESNVYGDIIQINVTDAYHNVVYKAMAVLQWITTYCINAEFVIKMDDDILVDPSLLLLGLYKNRNYYSEFILGELRTNRTPERTESIKWHLSYEEYPYDNFPPFVPGPVFGYPTSTAKLLYQQAIRTKPIWLDDVFITGICSKILGIPVLNDENFSHVHRPMITQNFIYS